MKIIIINFEEVTVTPLCIRPRWCFMSYLLFRPKDQSRVDFSALLCYCPLPEVYLSDVYRIWQHLVEIVKGGQVSVIITTHYIEEARQANMVRYTVS